jgi:hypothetical protein
MTPNRQRPPFLVDVAFNLGYIAVNLIVLAYVFVMPRKQ